MNPDYTILDRPEALAAIFHPRPESDAPPSAKYVSDHLIEVETSVHVGARFHAGIPRGANLLFFHGNGEIVADYDELGPIYNDMGINLLAVDYRGYGRSNGSPSVSTMMADGHVVLNYVQNWLRKNKMSGPLIIMGRSLGSASALELAAGHSNAIQGLIIESGFAYAAPLLRMLGIHPDLLGFKEKEGFGHLDKIGQYSGPTLVIHAEFDHIIPFSDGKALFAASPAKHKNILKIEGANHNDILLRGFSIYMQAVQEIIHHIKS